MNCDGSDILARWSHRHTLRLDSDTPFALQFHGIKNLLSSLSLSQSLAFFDESIRQGGLTLIDASDDREAAY
jgi:hypothetical protein